MKYYFFLLVSILFFAQCKDDIQTNTDAETATLQKSPTEAIPFQPNKLTTQKFVIDINQSYSLITQSGIIIQVPKGSLVSKQNPVHFEIKEALSMVAMFKAGLLTQSGGDVLQSGGMFQLEFSPEQQVQINKPLRMLVPTKELVEGMQLYSGERTKEGQLNWVQPRPLNASPMERKIAKGQTLFNTQCASCHNPDMVSSATGPPLANIALRRSKEWIYRFTRNSAAVIDSHVLTEDGKSEYIDYYAQCIYKSWGKTAMTAFPNLSDQELDSLYSFIEAISKKHPNFNPGLNCDSCEKYQLALRKEEQVLFNIEAQKHEMQTNVQQIQLLKNKLAITMKGTSEVFENKVTFNAPISSGRNNSNDTRSASANQNTVTLTAQEVANVQPELTTGLFYDLNITTTGWYNIDVLIEGRSEVARSELAIQVQGSVEQQVRVQLMIPKLKISLPGYRHEGENFYVKFADGKIPLPQGEVCIVVAIAEKEEKLYADTIRFIAQQQNSVHMQLKESNPEQLNAMLNGLHLNAFSAQVKVNEKYQAFKKLEQEQRQEEEKIQQINKRVLDQRARIKALQFLKPRTCDCDFNTKEEVANKDSMTNGIGVVKKDSKVNFNIRNRE